MKKKILSLTILLILILSFTTNIYATFAPSFVKTGTFTLSIESTLTTVSENSSTFIRVSAKEIDMSQGLTTLSFTLDYPKDLMQPIEKRNINLLLGEGAQITDFDSATGKVSIRTSKFITSNTPIFQVECKPKSGTTGKKLKITLKDIKGSNGSNSANALEVSSSIDIGTEDIKNKEFRTGPEDKIPNPPAEQEPIDPIPVDPQKIEPKDPLPVNPPEIPKEDDDTKKEGENPEAGIEDIIVPSLIALAALSLLFTYRYISISNAKVRNISKDFEKFKDEKPFNIDIK